MRKLFTIFVVTGMFMCQMSLARAEYLDDLCGRWVGQTTVANNDDPSVPFVMVGMAIEINAIEEANPGGRLFVGSVQFLGASGPPAPFDLTGIFFGHLMKASTAGTVVTALLSWDGTTLSGYYLDTLLIPGTQAHPQTGKFVLMKETD
jgi:hypothetical protein